jgi:hypothetical protein
MGRRGVHCCGLGWGQVAGCCEYGDEHSGYMKWCLARRPVVRGVGCWAVHFRLTCVQRGGLGGMPASWSGGPGFKFRLVDGLCRDLAWCISYSLKTNSGIVPLSRNHPFQFITCTLISLNYKFVWIQILTLWNKFKWQGGCLIFHFGDCAMRWTGMFLQSAAIEYDNFQVAVKTDRFEHKNDSFSSNMPFNLRFSCWGCGFESHRGHGCLSVVSVVCCEVEISATDWSLLQRSPTDCGV